LGDVATYLVKHGIMERPLVDSTDEGVAISAIISGSGRKSPVLVSPVLTVATDFSRTGIPKVNINQVFYSNCIILMCMSIDSSRCGPTGRGFVGHLLRSCGPFLWSVGSASSWGFESYGEGIDGEL